MDATPTGRSNSDSATILDTAGILEVRLIDPFSQLLSTILKLSFHAVGFYYEEPDRSKYNVILFNTYDNRFVPWLPSGCSIGRLGGSTYVDQIQCYPLSQRQSDALFRTAIIEVINLNSKMIALPEQSYQRLLRNAAHLEQEGAGTSLITGYTLVNQVLLKLDPARALSGLDSVDLDPATIQMTLASALLNSSWLQKPILLPLVFPRTNDLDRLAVAHQSRQEIDLLVQLFRELWDQDSRFKHGIVTRWDPAELDPIQSSEKNGLNELNSESEINSEIPLILKIPSTSVSSIDLEKPRPIPNPALADLGENLSHIVNLWNEPEPLILDLGGLVNLYNRAISGTELAPIIIPSSSQPEFTLSRSAILILPGAAESGGDLTCLVGSETITISMHHPNLSGRSQADLIGLLIYIDSLTSNSKGETRYASLQNQIVHELALRKRHSDDASPY